jgi:hypothetical protein
MLDQSYLDLDIPRQPVRWVVSVSSGASSAVAAERTMAKYGKDNVDLVFADTTVEHADNYRFLNDLEKRWGKPIIRLADGRNPQTVWDDKQLIPTDQFAPCTYELKLKLIIEHVQKLRAQGYAVVMCVGMSLKDTRKKSPLADKYPPHMGKWYPGRMLATAVNWSKAGLAFVDFPCMNKPVDFDVLETVKTWGIELPAMYAMGFTSANCEGKCPKGGVKHWRRVLTHFPVAFKEIEDWETNKRKDPHFEPHAILTHRVNGADVIYPLAELRKDTEGRNPLQMRLLDMQDDMDTVCTTSECGVGWDDAA